MDLWWEGNAHYGTHDWVADKALQAILDGYDTSTKLKWFNGETTFWTERRKMIFLIGTEAPDAKADTLRISLRGKDGTRVPITGFCDIYRHHFYFNSEDFTPRSQIGGLATQFTRKTNDIQKFLREGQCDLAAFWMGVLIHYITDLSNWYAVLDKDTDYLDRYYPVSQYSDEERLTARNYLRDYYHKKFESLILKATDDPSIAGDTQDETRFQYNTKFPIIASFALTPLECAKFNAFSTRFDIEPNYALGSLEGFIRTSSLTKGDLDAITMLDIYIPWADNMKYERGLTIANFPPAFKDKVQEWLQEAIIYSAFTINYFADSWDELGEVNQRKYCADCDDEDKGSDMTSSMAKKALRYSTMLLSTVLFMGLAMSSLLPVMMTVVPAVAKGKSVLAVT